MRKLTLALAVVALVGLAGCGALGNPLGSDSPGTETASAGPPHAMSFENTTAEAGLDYEGDPREVGAGNNAVYAADVDNDGWTDLLFVGGDRPALYRNTGGAFERASSFPAVDARLKSATVVDYDSDGWRDVILFRESGRPVALHNDEGRFERAGDLGLGNLTYPLGATAADYDRDGDTDLFVYQSGNWADRYPVGYNSPFFSIGDDNGNPNVLYENTGGGPDGEVYERQSDTGIEGERWSLAASFADLNGDGYPDIHVANDYNNDTVYINQGDGTFRQNLLGTSTARNGMSSEVADISGDGRMDVFVTNVYIPLEENRDEMGEERFQRIERLFNFVIHSGRTEGNTLVINQGNGTFEDRAPAYNLQHGGWGWAADATDFNNDGYRDVISATENVVRVDRDDPVWTYPMVWRGRPDNRSLGRVNESSHGMGEIDGRGMATLDYDGDGDRDIVFSTSNGPPVLYENTVSEGQAVQFEVVSTDGTIAHGATIEVTANGRTTVLQQTDENDFFSQETTYQQVGLDDAESATLSVTWPDGTNRTFEVEAGQRLRVSPDGVRTVLEFSDGE